MRMRSHRACGLTLIEITIALAIAALVTGTAMASLSALTDASLRSTAVELTGAIKESYDRAIMEKRIQRIGMDMEKGTWWLEYSQDPFSLSAERTRGTKGEKTEDEDLAKERRRGMFGPDDDEEVATALEGGKSARFVADEEIAKPKALPSGVSFSRIWTGHQEESFTTGIAYLHFFRGGFTEPAQIELTDGDAFVTLKVAALTGRVRTMHERLDKEETRESDRTDEGDE